MPISIKNDNQIAKMRAASNVVAKAHQLLESNVKVGITTLELDKIAHDFILSQGAQPSFLGYGGYPASICTSINEEVIHGIPGPRKLNSGDIISIDIGAYLDGYHADAARTHFVDNCTDDVKKLIEVTKTSFFEGIKYAKEGCYLHEISEAIENFVKSNGFSVVKEFVGHGIGQKLHEPPHVPNYKQLSRGPKLCKGMTLAIEPMVNLGTADIIILDDDWTVCTVDKKYSAHYENTIAITDAEPELLTIY